MGPIYVPSIWDYLAQAGTQGINSFQQSRERADAEARQKRAEAMQGLQMLMSMESQGLVPYQDVNSQIAGMQSTLPWLKGAQMRGPSEGGMRAQIANTPDKVPELQLPNLATTSNVNSPVTPVAAPSKPAPKMISALDQFTDAQRQRAGFKTRAETEAQQLGIDAQKFALESGKAAETRAADTFAFESSMRPLKAIEAVTPLMDAAAARHVSAYINASKGKLNRNNLSAVADSAYKEFIKTADGQAIIKANPSSGVYARSYFDDAVRKAFLDQEEMDLKRWVAASQASNRGMQPNDAANALTAVARNLTDRAQNIRKGLGPAGTVANFSAEALAKLPPETQQRLAEVVQLEQEAGQYNSLAAGVLSGSVSPELARQRLGQYLQTTTAPGMDATPPQSAQAPIPGGKRKITADQAEYLKSRGQFDPKLYEVIK